VKLNLLENVRSACKVVAEKANFVRINHDSLPAYATSLPLEQISTPELDPEKHYLGQGHGTVAFFLTLDTINFGSGYFPHMRKRPGMSGYFTVAASLNDYYKSHGPIGPHKLTQLTARECTEILDQDPHKEPIQELMQHFAKALNDLGRYLIDCFHGSFIELVEAAGSSTERLVQILIEMPYFQDAASYNKIEVPFYKRAQLTAADLSIAFSGEGPGCFNDLDCMTIFADNLVPHVLRIDNILIYDADLASCIDQEKLIPPGSLEEIEIRACAVHAVELLKCELLKSEYSVTSIGLDYLLWNRGQQPYYKSFPRHRTRSVFY
jgi:hypothetical protein